MRGRKPNTTPATAYDYRRYIALVQVLATWDARKVDALARAWNIEPDTDITVTIMKLADAAIAYHRNEAA